MVYHVPQTVAVLTVTPTISIIPVDQWGRVIVPCLQGNTNGVYSIIEKAWMPLVTADQFNATDLLLVKFSSGI